MEKLYLVIPCYNEEEVLPETKKRLLNKFQSLIQNKKIKKNSRIIFVNDGSKDKTWELIQEFSKESVLIGGICLTRNYGHQNALLAGILTVKDDADIVISMDCDLQDDIDAIDLMLEKRKEGNEIVYGVRKSRNKDTFFKKSSALLFYKFMSFMGIDIVYNHADYRLVSRCVLNCLDEYREVNLFLRGMFPLIGYSSDIVYYDRKERFAGESKYPLKKMINFACDGITSFSIKPIRLILHLGILILVLSFMMMIYSVFRKLTGNTVAGWTFLNCSLWFLGGVQMLSLGIIGEYIGKIYNESKQRPRYHIYKCLNCGKDSL